MAYWILQGNQKDYRIFDALADASRIRTWTVARYLRDITPGDEFALWASGPSSGVYAFGVVTDAAEQIPGDADPYWNDPAAGNQPTWRVGISFQDILDKPILRAELSSDPDFAGAPIMRMPGGGNPFPVTEPQWRAILAHRAVTVREPGEPVRNPARARDELGDTPPSGSTKTVRLDWTREEVILAMDFYVTSGALGGKSIPGQDSSEIAQLSALLKELSAYPPERQGEKYRNPQGVYLKLMNLRAIQTDGAHGMNAYSQLDAAVWRDYMDNLAGLHAEAAALRQRLKDGVLVPASVTAPVVEDVPIEQQHTERYMVTPSGEPRAAERAEQKLVLRYRDYMASKGVAVGRKKYVPRGQVRPIYSDAWVEDLHALIEAKNSDSRDALRQAIGQLYDYRRFHLNPVSLAVLLPYQPNPDGLALLRSAGIEAVWPHGPGFRDSARGAFV